MARKLLKLTTLLSVMLIIFLLAGCPSSLKRDVTLEVSITGEGTVSPGVGEHTYKKGDKVKLTATPADGYSWVEWLINDTSYEDQEVEITLEKDTEANAVFSQDEYTLTVNDPENGNVSVDPDKEAYTYGEEATLTAEEATGYDFDKWIINGETKKDNPVKITMKQNTIVEAFFVPENYTLTMTIAEGEGEIEPDEGVHTYPYGSEVSIAATPAPGYLFDKWSGDLESTSTTESLTIDGNKFVKAHFNLDPESQPVIKDIVVSPSVKICGGKELIVEAEVLNADTVSFLLGDSTPTSVGTPVGDLYNATFVTPILEDDDSIALKVTAENEYGVVEETKSIIVYKYDDTPPYLTMEVVPADCNATQTIVQFEVCDETALDEGSLDWETSHGTAVMTTEPNVEDKCLTRGELTWEFGDVDCEDIEIEMKILDVCGNETSATQEIHVDNMKPVIDYVTDKGACSEEVQYVEWKVTENCLLDFDATTCCEAVDVEFGGWVEDDSGDRIVTTIPATMTFNREEDCTEFEFDVTAVDKCDNEAEQDKFVVDKDLRDPRIRVYGFLNEEYFTPHLSTLVSELLGIYDLSLDDEDATPVNINDPAEEGNLYGPECDDARAYYVWIAEDDCIDKTLIEYDNVCRTGQKVESFTAIPGVVVGYQRIDFDCVTDCEEIQGDLTVWDECGNDATGEATITVDNLPPRVDWEIEDVQACGATETTISWNATDGSEKVHVFFELSDGSIPELVTDGHSYYSTDTSGSVQWEFEEIDCEDPTATITVIDDCEGCWGECKFVTEDATYSIPCSEDSDSYFYDAKTIHVDNVEPTIDYAEGYLTGNEGQGCNYSKAYFSMNVCENCVDEVYVEYWYVTEDSTTTPEQFSLTEDGTFSCGEVEIGTTYEGTMTLDPYDGATITAVGYAVDTCEQLASETLIDGVYFDSLKPEIDYEMSKTKCIVLGDVVTFAATATDNGGGLDDPNNVDIIVESESGEVTPASSYTIDDAGWPSVSATEVSYHATLTILEEFQDEYTVTLVATDGCGNRREETLSFEVDSVVPDLDNFAFNSQTDKLWFWLTEDIFIPEEATDVLLTIYVWTGDSSPTDFEPEEGNPVVIGDWNKIVQGTSSDFYNTDEALYYNKDLEHGWMEDILIANLTHDELNYDLTFGVYYAFVLEEIADSCGNKSALDGFGKATSFSPEF